MIDYFCEYSVSYICVVIVYVVFVGMSENLAGKIFVIFFGDEEMMFMCIIYFFYTCLLYFCFRGFRFWEGCIMRFKFNDLRSVCICSVFFFFVFRGVEFFFLIVVLIYI